MKNLQNIGFELLEKNDEEVVLKRVLSRKNGKRRSDIELSLPKLSIQYFDVNELEGLQDIASTITKSLVEKRQKHNLKFKIISLLRLSNVFISSNIMSNPPSL